MDTRFDWIRRNVESGVRPFIFGVLSGALFLSSASFGADQACLEYEPAVVTLEGIITRHVAYGPPGYGEDPAHDVKERGWYLDLDTSICVNGKNEDSPDMEGEREIRRLQIVYDKYPKGRGWIGHRAVVTGTLFHAISGHHHTKVLIQATNTTHTTSPATPPGTP